MFPSQRRKQRIDNAVVNVQQIVGEYADQYHGNKIRQEDQRLGNTHKAAGTQIVKKNGTDNLAQILKKDERQII